ncbi:DNA damage-inducible transcript 4-like protein [Nerophis ophidion]|uniref:DNA damage-inducible transcript 4-like protein n=1 Tax=Nerophis ophidion TaxID=159077 RepID=UPI002AE08790|nr:DNA damage-inducible transcript 4-like protein [Nerophis ophidion]
MGVVWRGPGERLSDGFEAILGHGFRTGKQWAVNTVHGGDGPPTHRPMRKLCPGSPISGAELAEGPEKLTRRIAGEVLHLASCEPCGLRGCVLYVLLELDKGCQQLERIVCDASVVPTFEMTLVFKKDGTAWPSLRYFLFMGTYFAPNFRRALKLSPGFRLVKKKKNNPCEGCGR